jgi:hypothetical protein
MRCWRVEAHGPQVYAALETLGDDLLRRAMLR